MAASITFDFISRGGPALAADFKRTGDNAAAAARGAKVLQDVIKTLGEKENRTAAESALLAKALRQTGDAEDRAAAKALAADIAIRRLDDALKDSGKNAGSARGSFGGLAGEITGFGAASTAASSKSSLFARALAGINLASGVLEPALAGVAVAAGGIAAAFAAAGAGALAYSAALKPLLSQTQDVIKAQETLDKAQATAQANYAAAIKSGVSAKTADAARTKAMTAAQDQYNIAVKGTPGPVREFAKSVAGAKATYTSWADSLARPVLGPLSMALKLLKPALTAITPLVRVTAGAFGMLVTELAAKVNAGGLTSVVSTLLPHVRDTILDLGHAAGNVAAGIWGILKAFMPVSGQITAGVVKLTAKFKEWGQSLSSGTGFQSLMATFREETPQAVAILKNLGAVLANVAKAVFGLSSFSNSKALLNLLLPLSGAMASLSKNTDLVRVAMYALMAVKIGQQFSWIGPAWKSLVLFAAAAEGATVAETIAAAATRAWGLAMMALPWVALAAAVVAVAVLIIKYHSQIWAFVQRVWHDILAVIMGTWDWVKTHWPLLVAIITGPIGLAVLFIIKHWTTMTTGIAALFDIAKNKIGIAWDQIELAALRGVKFILDKMGLLPFGMGEPFRKAAKSIGNSMAGIQADVARRTGQIQADFDRLHGKTVQIRMNGQGLYTITGSVIAASQGKGGSGNAAGGLAAGGFISGGTPGRDSVLAWLMPGEVVVPVNKVQQGAVDHLRGELPGFKSGGQVSGPLTAPFVSGMYSSFQNQMTGSMVGAMRTSLKTAEAAAIAAAKAAAASGVSGAGPVGGDAGTNRALARRMFPWPASQWPAFNTLEMHEAGYNRFARNASSGAYGIPQALPPTKMPFAAQAAGGSHAGPQLSWMFNYIRQRYGTPANAWARYYAHPGGVGWYARGGLVPGYASGGTVGQQGRTYLNAWRSRHGGGFGAAHGPVVVNEQIARMSAAAGRAQSLAGAAGLSPGQHRFWAKAAAGEKKRLAVLHKELATERAWRYQLELGELGLDKQIRAAGNLPGLAGPVRGWKAQLGRDKATVAAISKMLGYSNAYLACTQARPEGDAARGARVDPAHRRVHRLDGRPDRQPVRRVGPAQPDGDPGLRRHPGPRVERRVQRDRPARAADPRRTRWWRRDDRAEQPRRHRVPGPARRLARPVPRQPQTQTETLTLAFGWHVLSECPDEGACLIHGRNKTAMATGPEDFTCPDCELPEPHERGTECALYEWDPDDIWGPRHI